VGSRTVGSLLYADDIVLIADTEEELQQMIDVVEKFTSEWRLSLNTGKSKVMVVRASGDPVPIAEADDSEDPAAGRESEHNWTWRGETLEVVHQYKYLGVLVTDKLLWQQHIKKVSEIGKETLLTLRRFFAQRQLPLAIKRLVYTGILRAKLEYGSQVWTTNSVQEKTLESIQHQAVVWMLRTNSRASQFALRMIIGLPSLKARRDMLRLFYVGILLRKKQETIPRICFETPLSTECRVKGISQAQWLTYFNRLVDESEDLEASYSELRGYINEDGQVPEIIHVAGQDGKFSTVRPISDWRGSVRKFIDGREMRRFQQESQSRTTLGVLAASYRTSLKERLPVISCTPSPANWIRIRLLSGTSALNFTMHRITRGTRALCCPMCEGEEETVVHFLRECEAASFVKLRTELEGNMPEYFNTLSSLQQCAYILGTPVRVPSDPSAAPVIKTAGRREDAISVQYIKDLYGLRSARLSETLGVSNDIDMTVPDPIDAAADPSAATAPVVAVNNLFTWLRGVNDTDNVRSPRSGEVEAHGVIAQLRR
jgi:hypothetical protein